MTESSSSPSPPTEGSWTPTIIILSLIIMKWILTSEGDRAIQIRRWGQMQKLQLKKKMGYRDDSKYKMGAGDGANQKYKRQG